MYKLKFGKVSRKCFQALVSPAFILNTDPWSTENRSSIPSKICSNVSCLHHATASPMVVSVHRAHACGRVEYSERPSDCTLR
jgi:hypothetical protein